MYEMWDLKFRSIGILENLEKFNRKMLAKFSEI